MPMSGPIVRSGPTPEFSRNWESVFGQKKGAKAATGSVSKPATGPKKKAKAAPKAATKSAKKKAAKKRKK